jgi:hypothetical protein
MKRLNNSMQVYLMLTGVKHLHHKAPGTTPRTVTVTTEVAH